MHGDGMGIALSYVESIAAETRAVLGGGGVYVCRIPTCQCLKWRSLYGTQCPPPESGIKGSPLFLWEKGL
jgi:hypothetical protein